MEEMVFQIGPIRPPSEANSLLLRVTINCPWNKCKFCMLYKKYDFHTRPVEDVKKRHRHNGRTERSYPAVQNRR